jgi:hypothetical protein
MRKQIPLILSLLLLVNSPVHAYVPDVHMRMTERAFDRTAAAALERHVGIFPNDLGAGTTPRKIMAQGASDEDRIWPQTRSRNHFLGMIVRNTPIRQLESGFDGFTVGSSSGFLAIDDVSWEYVIP